MLGRIIAVLHVVLILHLWFAAVSWSESIDSGVVVRYDFDLNSHSNGDVHGASPANGRQGEANTAFRFNGVNDWVGVEGLDCLLNYDRDWSVNLWVYLDGTGKHSVMFAGADGDAGARQFAIASKYVKITHKADTASDWRVDFKESAHNSWHMYTVTWASKGHLKVYVDGLFQGEDSTGDLDDFCPRNEPIIGAVNFFRKTQYFKGIIDDFRVYDRVLSEAEVGELFTVSN